MVLRRMRLRVDAQPLCSGKWKWRQSRSSSQSLKNAASRSHGSSEDNLSLGVSVSWRIACTRSRRWSPKSTPHEPRWTPVSTISFAPPWSAPRTSVTTSRHRTTAPAASRERRHAEAAVIVTTILHLDERARAVPRTGYRLARDRHKYRRVIQCGQHTRYQCILECIRNNLKHPGHAPRFGWSHCGPAAGGQDVARTVSSNPADQRPRIRRGLARDDAGIDHGHIGLFRRAHDLMSGSAKLPGHALDLSLVQATPYGVQVDFHGSTGFGGRCARAFAARREFQGCRTTKLSNTISAPGSPNEPARIPTSPSVRLSSRTLATCTSFTYPVNWAPAQSMRR